MKSHKHDGLLTSSGSLRSHPINRQHKDLSVQKEHNKSLSKSEQTFWQGNKPKAKDEIKTPTKKKATPNYSSAKKGKRELFEEVNEEKTIDGVLCQIDGDGYINIDVDSLTQKGVRLKFTRREGRTKKTVGLTIART